MNANKDRGKTNYVDKAPLAIRVSLALLCTAIATQVVVAWIARASPYWYFQTGMALTLAVLIAFVGVGRRGARLPIVCMAVLIVTLVLLAFFVTRGERRIVNSALDFLRSMPLLVGGLLLYVPASRRWFEWHEGSETIFKEAARRKAALQSHTLITLSS